VPDHTLTYARFPSQPSTFDLTCCVSRKEHNLDFYIGRHVHEDPSVIQMGGSVPEELARATEVVAHYGNYSEFNLNCGCPSPKVRLPLCFTQQWHTVYCTKCVVARVYVRLPPNSLPLTSFCFCFLLSHAGEYGMLRCQVNAAA
jgi:hypothetical protein